LFSLWITPSLSKCGAMAQCELCTVNFGCGWCVNKNGTFCLNGTRDGPIENQKDCDFWNFDVSSCNKNQDYCLYVNNCSQCVAHANCGWTGLTCVLGSGSGPDDKNAIFAPAWYHVVGSCQNMDCSKFNNCLSCNTQRVNGTHGCGWCSTTNKCLFGNISNSNDSKCDSWNWAQCKDDINCSKNNDCSSCIKDSSFNCGWCSDTKKCIKGTNKNISSPCQRFQYGICRDSCYERSYNCSTCVSSDRCGWCHFSSGNGGFCASGNKDSSISVPRQQCAPWMYSNCHDRQCQSFGECGSCINSGCHWVPKDTRCSTTFGINGCEDCSKCSNNAPNSIVVILIAAGTTIIVGGVLVFAAYIFITKFWRKRHFYSTLK